MIKEITSINNPFFKELLKLNNKKDRKKEGKFLLEGYHLVKEAYNHKKLVCVLSCNSDSLNEFSDIDSYKVSKELIKKLSTTDNPQDIIGVSEFVHNTKLTKPCKVVLLDNVQDPGNMGTIIRTSASFGYDAVMLSSDCVDIYNEKVIRSTQGTLFKTNIIINDIESLIKNVKELNLKVYSTYLGTDITIDDIKKESNFCVTFGNEAHGIRDYVKDNSDVLFKLEMKNSVESLNVAVACGIVLYELSK